MLIGVTNARANVGSIQATPELLKDPQAFAQFQAAQGELSSALSRLLVVVEHYPDLKADANFLDLQAQLEGTENRITVARNRYIAAVQEYNVTRAQLPDQPDRDDVRVRREAELLGRERSGDLATADGRFQAVRRADSARRFDRDGRSARRAIRRAGTSCGRVRAASCCCVAAARTAGPAGRFPRSTRASPISPAR